MNGLLPESPNRRTCQLVIVWWPRVSWPRVWWPRVSWRVGVSCGCCCSPSLPLGSCLKYKYRISAPQDIPPNHEYDLVSETEKKTFFNILNWVFFEKFTFQIIKYILFHYLKLIYAIVPKLVKIHQIDPIVNIDHCAIFKKCYA